MVGDWLTYLFSFQGRINRAKLWLFLLVVASVYLGLTLVFAALFMAAGPKSGGADGAGALLIIVGLLSLFAIIALLGAGIALTVRRLHDRNKSGWWSLLFMGAPSLLDGMARALMASGEVARYCYSLTEG